jgi:gluconate kinase
MQTKAFLGIGEWKFLQPLFIGDTVHVKTEVINLNSKNRRQGRVTWLRQLVNQADEVIQQGEFETIVACTSLRVRRDDGRTGDVAGPKTMVPTHDSSTTDGQRKSA